ncbi:MAG: acyltransferase [Verrucomicrobiae bacterium]|nr:acyltransferase [Verrucomicrobiae bacterium]MCB1130120.1 acyltransferase [Verrucomicrobiae bacterium]MCP5533244.1 acyltransferase [Akkermansiaceae bacterium]MCP5545439.1 acyltransferase [Akkermansiaceae bacterium]MCP5548959.1 acyltransferase [Akkermansiaceae bacterium]
MTSGRTDYHGANADSMGKVGSMESGRRDAVEFLRILAACGVVWFHTPGGAWKDMGYAGLLGFVMISSYFLMVGARKDVAGVYFHKRISRVIAPWAFWMLVYGAFNLIRGKDLFPSSEGIVTGLLTGTWIGLWYLPFVLVMAALVFFFAKATADIPAWVGSGLWLILGTSAMRILPSLDAKWLALTPWAQWLNALPAVFFGLSIHEALRLPVVPRWTFLLLTVVLVEAVAVWMWHGHRGVSITYGLSIVPVAAAFLSNARLPRRLVAGGALCLGVYLMHALFIGGFRMIPSIRNSPLLLFVLAVMLSFGVTAALQRNRISKSVV